MNIAQSFLRFVLVISVGIAIGFAGMYHVNNKQEKYDKEHNDIKPETRLASRSNEIDDKVSMFNMLNSDFERGNHNYKVAEWADRIEGLPKSKERDAFAAAIVEATRDDVITDAEYKTLSEQNRELSNININTVTKNNAANIRDGKPITDDRTEADKNDMKRLDGMALALSLAIFQEQRIESEDNYSAALKEKELALKTVKRPKDVSAWVYKLDTYPKSKERDALAEHVIAVLEDNEITDDEYNALRKEMAELESINNVRKIRNTAEKTLSDNK